MVSDKLSVGELMTTQMTALEPIMLVSKLETVLRRCAHQAFPITSEVEKAFAASMLLHLSPTLCVIMCGLYREVEVALLLATTVLQRLAGIFCT